jgi:hypothetical protein
MVVTNRTSHSIQRRRFLQLGAYGALAATLNSGTTRYACASPAANQRIKSCILGMHYGGPSHLDTWDMKPDGPAEIRGEYKPVATNIPGRFVCEHLPLMSQLADKVALIRSMHHPMTNHNAAMYEALVGRLPEGGDNEILPAERATDCPSYGSTLTYLTEQGELPRPPTPLTHVALPHILHNVVDLAGQTAGFLGGRYDPLQITSDPNDPSFRVNSLSLPVDVSKERLTARRELLGDLNTSNAGRADPQIRAYRERVFDLLRNKDVQGAFDIRAEPANVRDRYGRHKFGQSMLLARRLVETGVPFINVNDKRVNAQVANWDSHETIFPRHKELLPVMDQGLSALIEDLDQVGLLESTLVVSMGEFGRTPKINGNAGRDHWPQCYHVVLSGGGVDAGVTYGSSDQIGAYPDDRPVTPGDLAATLFWRFGVDPHHELHDAFGRPFRLATGQPLKSLFPRATS